MNLQRVLSLNLVAILLLSLSACSLGSFFAQTEDSNILFKDDFSDPSSGWKKVSVENGETDYANGAYRIRVSKANMDVWGNPGLDFVDVRIEVDAIKVNGVNDNRFGLICRYQATNQFYMFLISSDGYYGIGKVKGDNYTLVGQDSLQPSEKIFQGTTPNHLRADCVGDTLTLYANGEKLAEAHDAEFTSGDAGLVAGSYGTPGTEILFDNFVVLKPEG